MYHIPCILLVNCVTVLSQTWYETCQTNNAAIFLCLLWIASTYGNAITHHRRLKQCIHTHQQLHCGEGGLQLHMGRERRGSIYIYLCTYVTDILSKLRIASYDTKVCDTCWMGAWDRWFIQLTMQDERSWNSLQNSKIPYYTCTHEEIGFHQ